MIRVGIDSISDKSLPNKITNVYTLGATAFALFSDYARSHEAWALGDEAFIAATKAVSDNRDDRQQCQALRLHIYVLTNHDYVVANPPS